MTNYFLRRKWYVWAAVSSLIVLGATVFSFFYYSLSFFQNVLNKKEWHRNGYVVLFHSVQTHWLNIRPYLSFSDVQIFSETDKEKRVVFPVVKAYAFWLDLFRGHFLPDTLAIEGGHFSLVQTPNGFTVNHFSKEDWAQVSESSDFSEKETSAAFVLSGINELVFRGTVADIQNNAFDFLSVTDLSVRFVRSSDHFDFSIASFHSNKLAEGFAVTGSFFQKGNRVYLSDNMHLSLEKVHLPFLKSVLPQHVRSFVSQGEVDFWGSVSFHNGLLKGLKGRSFVHQMSLKRGEKSYFFPYISGYVDLSVSPQESHLSIDDLQWDHLSLERFSPARVSFSWKGFLSFDYLSRFDLFVPVLDASRVRDLALFCKDILPQKTGKISAYLPQGTLHDTSFSWASHSPDKPSSWHIHTIMYGHSYGFSLIRHILSYRAWVDGNQDHGQITLNNTQLDLSLSPFLERMNTLDASLSGSFFWDFRPQTNDFCFSGKNIVALSPVVHLQLTHLQACPAQAQSNHYAVDAEGRIVPQSLVFARDHLPLSISPHVRSWISRSFLEGELKPIHMHFSSLFDLSSQTWSKEKDWSLTTEFVDTRFRLGRDVLLDHAQAHLSIHNRSLNVLGGAVFYGIPVSHLSVYIDDFYRDDSKSNILVQLHMGEESVKKYVYVLTHLSSLMASQALPSSFLEKFYSDNMSGQFELKSLFLSIPIWSKRDVLSYWGILEGHDFQKDILHKSSTRHLVVNRLLASVFNGQYFVHIRKLHIAPDFEGNGFLSGNKRDLYFSLDGRCTLEDILKDFFNIYFTRSYLNGSLETHLSGHVKKDQVSIHLQSDLVGIQSLLPEPFFKKERNKKKPITVDYVKGKDQSLLDMLLLYSKTHLVMHYGKNSLSPSLQSVFFCSKKLKPFSPKTNVSEFSSFSANTKPQSVVHEKSQRKPQPSFQDVPQEVTNEERAVKPVWVISIDTPFIDQNQWISLVKAGAFGQSLGGMPSELLIATKRMKFGFFSIRNIRARILSDSQRIFSRIVSPNVVGSIFWNKPTNHLSLYFDKAIVSESRATEGEDISRLIFQWPDIELSIHSLIFHDIPLGEIQLTLENRENVARVKHFSLRNSRILLELQGQSQLGTDSQVNQISFQSVVYNMGQLLFDWKQPVLISGGRGLIHGDLHWLGPLIFWNNPSISGSVDVQFSQGQFNRVSPGIGRLLGLFSVQALPRRFLLDFHDVLSPGFFFDSLKGVVKINEGVLTVKDMLIRGPSSRITLSGSTGLVDHVLDMDVCVFPKVSNTFSVAATALAGFPLAGVITWMAQNIFRDPIGNLLTRAYSVSGFWSNPEVQKRDVNDCSLRELPRTSGSRREGYAREGR